MRSQWQRVRFSEIVRPNSRPYTLGPEQDANLVGMRLYGAGPFHRELKPAMRIAKKTHFVIKAGDVIYNKLFAWKGTFGIVPPELDGMFVSDKFPTYELDRSRVDERFLRWYFRCPPLWEEARVMSTGSAALSKLTLNPPKFLHLTIPLPPLAEQRRVVTRIEGLAAEIHEALALRQQAAKEADALLIAELRRVFCLKEPQIPLGEVLQLHRGFDLPKQFVIPGPYPVIGSNGEIGRHAETRAKGPGVCTGRSGSVGAVNYVEENFWPHNTTLYVSDFKGNSPRLIYFLLRSVTSELKGAGAHTAVPTLDRKKAHSQIKVHIPLVPEQHGIVAELDALQAEMDALKRLQAETAAELDALLPAILDKAFKGEL